MNAAGIEAGQVMFLEPPSRTVKTSMELDGPLLRRRIEL